MKRFKRLVFLVFLVGCVIISSQAFADKVYFTMGGAGAQGRWYAEVSFFAKLITENISNVTASGVVSPGVSRGNIKRIGNMELQGGRCFGTDFYNAYHKKPPLDEKDYGVTAWFMGPKLIMRCIAAPSVKSIKDLKGKKIGVGVRGSGDDELAINLLKHYGLSEKDVKLQFVGRKVAQNSFANHQIDAILIIYTRNNHRHLGPVFSARPVGKSAHFVPFKMSDLKGFVKKYPFLGLDTGGEPDFKTPNLNAVYVPTMLALHKTVDASLAYKMTKLIMTNWDQVTAALPWWTPDEVTPETAAKIPGMTPQMFHPGALKYYKEAGVIK